jgi:hypothetical protein
VKSKIACSEYILYFRSSYLKLVNDSQEHTKKPEVGAASHCCCCCCSTGSVDTFLQDKARSIVALNNYRGILRPSSIKLNFRTIDNASFIDPKEARKEGQHIGSFDFSR